MTVEAELCCTIASSIVIRDTMNGKKTKPARFEVMMASLVSAPNFDTGENKPSFLGSLPSGIKK